MYLQFSTNDSINFISFIKNEFSFVLLYYTLTYDIGV